MFTEQVGCAQRAREYYTKDEESDASGAVEILNAAVTVHAENAEHVHKTLLECGVSPKMAERYCQKLVDELQVVRMWGEPKNGGEILPKVGG